MPHFYTLYRNIIIVLFFGHFVIGCNIINPTEKAPTYIHIDSFYFKNNPAITVKDVNGGSLNTFSNTSHAINSIWAYYNGAGIGAFDLPVTFPVIAQGAGKLVIVPGISQDGLNSFLVTYPFYQVDTYSFIAKPGQVINHIPVTQFYTDAVVTVICNFETGIHGFNHWGDWGGANLTTEGYTSGPSYLQSHVGRIFLNSATYDTLSVDTSSPFTISYNTNSTNPAYIEMDYKNTAPFAVGIKGNLLSLAYDTLTLVNLYPTDTWKKVYLQVADYAIQRKATSYNFYIKTSLPPGDTRDTILIDNVQLITF